MQEHTLTTSRASKLLGIAMCTFAVVKACSQQLYLYLQRLEFEHMAGAAAPHFDGGSLFVVINLVEPAPWFITGLLFIVLSSYIQRLLR